MKLLAIDTATEACSVALWLDGEIRERFEIAGREHSLRMPQMLEALLADCGVRPSQIDGIACGVGPGSFAGVRVGVSFVKGMALAMERPVVPVSSLAMLAQAAAAGGAAEVLCALDARMHEVYFGVYDIVEGLAAARTLDVVAAPAQLGAVVPGNYAAVGSGWKAYAELLRTSLAIVPASLDAEALPHAADALRLALPAFGAGRGIGAAELQPLYLRNRVALTTAEQQAARR